MQRSEKVLFLHHAGPMITYDTHRILRIHDLNPQNEIHFYMSSTEMLQLAWKFFIAAWR